MYLSESMEVTLFVPTSKITIPLFGTGKVMESEVTPTTAQRVFRAMRNTQTIITQLRELLQESKEQGLITPGLFQQLYDTTIEADMSVEKEKEFMRELGYTEPDYTDQDSSTFNVTEEELEAWKQIVRRRSQSAA